MPAPAEAFVDVAQFFASWSTPWSYVAVTQCVLPGSYTPGSSAAAADAANTSAIAAVATRRIFFIVSPLRLLRLCLAARPKGMRKGRKASVRLGRRPDVDDDRRALRRLPGRRLEDDGVVARRIAHGPLDAQHREAAVGQVALRGRAVLTRRVGNGCARLRVRAGGDRELHAVPGVRVGDDDAGGPTRRDVLHDHLLAALGDLLHGLRKPHPAVVVAGGGLGRRRLRRRRRALRRGRGRDRRLRRALRDVDAHGRALLHLVTGRGVLGDDGARRLRRPDLGDVRVQASLLQRAHGVLLRPAGHVRDGDGGRALGNRDDNRGALLGARPLLRRLRDDRARRSLRVLLRQLHAEALGLQLVHGVGRGEAHHLRHANAGLALRDDQRDDRPLRDVLAGLRRLGDDDALRLLGVAPDHLDPELRLLQLELGGLEL